MWFSERNGMFGRAVFHTGGYGGPGHNSDGTGDEHANGSRSSNGTFGGGGGGKMEILILLQKFRPSKKPEF